LIFWGLVILAFSLRSMYFSQTIKYIQPGAGSDSYFYLEWARDIVRGNIIGKDVFYALPLYPYFLSLAYIFTGGEIFGIILIQILIGSINCGLIYVLGKELFNNQVGIVASLAACGYSMFMFYDRMLLPTSLAIFLGLILMLSLLRVRVQPSVKKMCIAGVLLGLCILTRAAFLLLAFFILFWIGSEFRKREPGKYILYGLSFLLPLFLIVTGVSLRNYLVANDPVFMAAHSGINFYIGNNPRADGLFQAPAFIRPTQSGLIEDAHIIAEKKSGRKLRPSETSRFWFRQSFSFIKKQPLAYLKLLGKKLALFWNSKEFVDDIEYYLYDEVSGFLRLPFLRFSSICPLALTGILLSIPLRKKLMLIYYFIFSLMIATIIFFINSRYRLMTIPYLIVFAAFAFCWMLEMCRKRQYRNFILSLILFLGLYFLSSSKIINASPQSNFTFHYNKGIYLFDQGNYKKAQQEFRSALKLNPHDYMSYLGLGNIYYELQDFSSAVQSYKKALAINPYFYKAYFNLGIAYDEIGHKKEAEKAFKIVLTLKPDDGAAHYNLGQIYQVQGLTGAALNEYEQALKIKPGNREILQAIEKIKQIIQK
jgi:tetratricopeptide (TPR) repeat protein